jgi:hypothetical protein
MSKVLFSVLLSFFAAAATAQPKAAAQSNAFLPAKIPGTTTLKTPTGVAGQANGVKSGPIAVAIDTAIRVNPKLAYLCLDFSALTGATQMEILSGKESYWVYDKAGKQVAMNDKVLHSVKAAMENSSVCDMKVRVPFRQKGDKNIYTIHYKWESPDKSKNIDIVTSK